MLKFQESPYERPSIKEISSNAQILGTVNITINQYVMNNFNLLKGFGDKLSIRQ